jgi:exodeoxyribonuclease V alpha subunit
VEYQRADLDSLTLAYAVSVYKSQGGEFPAVILCLLTQYFPLLQRNLLYTAVTRGKRLVVIVGSRKAMAIMVVKVIRVDGQHGPAGLGSWSRGRG